MAMGTAIFSMFRRISFEFFKKSKITIPPSIRKANVCANVCANISEDPSLRQDLLSWVGVRASIQPD
jgi:hypothetical protein